MPMDVKEDNNRRLVFNARNVDINIGTYGIKVDSTKIDELIRNKIGIEEWEDRIKLRGNITLIIEEVPRDVSIDSDFLVEKEELEDE